VAASVAATPSAAPTTTPAAKRFIRSPRSAYRVTRSADVVETAR
jgi:hypothetical protein